MTRAGSVAICIHRLDVNRTTRELYSLQLYGITGLLNGCDAHYIYIYNYIYIYLQSTIVASTIVICLVCYYIACQANVYTRAIEAVNVYNAASRLRICESATLGGAQCYGLCKPAAEQIHGKGADRGRIAYTRRKA